MGFLETAVFLGVSDDEKNGNIGDKGSIAERFVEIDARVFLRGTLTSRWVFQLTGPGTQKNLGFPWNPHVLYAGLKGR